MMRCYTVRHVRDGPIHTDESIYDIEHTGGIPLIRSTGPPKTTIFNQGSPLNINMGLQYSLALFPFLVSKLP